MHIFNEYFDNVYLLNTDRRIDRFKLMHKRLTQAQIQYEKFTGITGNTVNPFWSFLKHNSNYWPSSNTVACNISHLNIYRQALDRGEKRILILEDDLLIHKNSDAIFRERLQILPKWNLLYLCYIPLSSDQSYWNFNLINHIDINNYFFQAKDIWSLMAYALDDTLMSYMLHSYSQNFPCEIDRYFVNYVQTDSKFSCLGISPNLFCGDNLGSDNDTSTNTVNFTQRTIDRRFSQPEDFI